MIVNAGSHGHVIGLALHWEMWLLAQGGMSNLNALRSATANGARTLGLQQLMNEIGNYDRPRGRFFWEATRAPNDIY